MAIGGGDDSIYRICIVVLKPDLDHCNVSHPAFTRFHNKETEAALGVWRICLPDFPGCGTVHVFVDIYFTILYG